MAEFNPLSWWRAMLALPNDSLRKTLAVAFLVALVASVMVSVSAVMLGPLRLANLEKQRQAQMNAMIAKLPGMAEILRSAGAESLESHLVDINNAGFAKGRDPAQFNAKAAATDPAQSIELSAPVDSAQIGRRANLALVHIVRSHGDLALIVLPVYGNGYQSTLNGYLALRSDLNTIAGLTFYEQGETPGLGARIKEPAWEALWPGKQFVDQHGEIRIAVVRGTASGPHEVDGISGATRTGNGVTGLLRFWLGEHGFGPFLQRLRSGEIRP